jgi:flagellar hook protein FlgE
MSLGSVLHTALSGISAAELAVNVLANNLANAQTPGFKASKATFATQVPQTASAGAGPSPEGGGSNPIQVGTGVRACQIAGDFSQGTLAVESNPLSLAIQGDGLFILEGPAGERLYSRDGRFHLNADGELASSGGHRVLGHAADGNFQIQPDHLRPLRIPRGIEVPSPSGSAARLVGFRITGNGRIRGRFSDGIQRDLGQIRLARFANPSGLERRGHNVFAPGANSGVPIHGNPGESGAGEIVAGAIELSNTDIGQSLVELSLASIWFRANVQVVATGDELLDDLLALRRTA